MDLVDTPEWITLRGEELEVAVSRETGEIQSYRYRGHSLVLEGPRPNYWRPPTDGRSPGRAPFRARNRGLSGEAPAPLKHHTQHHLGLVGQQGVHLLALFRLRHVRDQVLDRQRALAHQIQEH